MSYETRVAKRQYFCEHCGNDKPWARKTWVFGEGHSFCSKYCLENFQSYLKKLARLGKLKPRGQTKTTN